MKKLAATVLLLIAFFLVLTGYIAPQQGALTPTSSINASDLAQAEPRYDEILPIQTVDMGRQGRSIIMPIVLFGHVQLANLALGGSWIIVATELLFIRSRKDRYRRLAKSMAFFSLILFSVGSTLGASALLYIFSLFPAFMATAFHIYWWPMLANLLLWSAQILFLWLYFYTWKVTSSYGHVFLGLGYAASAFFQALMIHMLGSGMLTPGAMQIEWDSPGLLTMDWSALLSWWFNPTLWSLQLHRLAAAVAFFGFLITILSMFHYGDKSEYPAARKYWDWAGSYGLIWGLAGLAAQPALGLFYMRQIMSSNQSAFGMIMHGPRAWEMLWMVALLSALVITSVIYFLDRRDTVVTHLGSRNIKFVLMALLIIAIAAAFVLVNPGWLGAAFRHDPSAWANPLGKMSYKYIALLALSIVSAMVVVIDTFMVGDAREQDWGNLPRSARLSGILAGALGMWVIMAMGFVKESAREPWLFWKVVPVPGGTSFPTPISIWNIFMVWAVTMAFFMTVFWYVSKVSVESYPRHGEEDPDASDRPGEPP